MLKVIKHLISVQEKRRYHIATVVIFCVFVGLSRGLLEATFFGLALKNGEYAAFIPFYLHLAFLLTFAIKTASGFERWRHIQLAVLIGIFLGIFPPILDLLFGSDVNVFYGYFFVHDFGKIPWLSYDPANHFPLGEAITVWASIIFCTVYIAIKSGSLLRTIAGFGMAYFIFLWAGVFFPMLVAYLSVGYLPNIEAVKAMDAIRFVKVERLPYWVAWGQMIQALVFFFAIQPKLIKYLFKRSLHPLPFILVAGIGLCATSAVTAIPISDQTWSTFFVGIFMLWWVAAVTLIQNEHFDAIDENEPPAKRLFNRNDVETMNVLYLLAVLFLFMLGLKLAPVLFLLFGLAMLYNYSFYRAKKAYLSNAKIEGAWAVGAFFIGVFCVPVDKLPPFILVISFLVFGGWSILSPLKDFKDILRDKYSGSSTVYVHFYNKGYKLASIHRFLLGLLLFSFSVPIAWLALQGALVWAVGLLLVFALLIYWSRSVRSRIWFAKILTAQSLYLAVLFLYFFKQVP